MASQRICKICAAAMPSDTVEDTCAQCRKLPMAELPSFSLPISSEKMTIVDSQPRPPSTFDLPRPGSQAPRGEPGTSDGVANQLPHPEAEETGPPPPTYPLQRTVFRYFGDYELIEEVARGGMGVVFKARQISLNRIVAVKMIITGQLASSQEAQRFRTEAEAAANLQHPNIVAIHEVGEHEGYNYFSMDFVAGKNLAERHRADPLSVAQAADCVKTIAEAIHYAHQRGILHRDLKPQNILMDPAGQPHITDFGLAKRLEQGSTLTQTGAVMGTPAYLSPEQAASRREDFCPASDVYSLGAILYELLTGRPPFLGATTMETLFKVMEADPIAPSQWNPKVPADLETICLKCLEKKPERRYATARQLAEELGRFQHREPILARPASVGRKIWSWSQRHPWAITGAASFFIIGLIGLAYGLWEHNQYLQWRAAHPGQPIPYLPRFFDSIVARDALIYLNVAGCFIFCEFLLGRRRGDPLPRRHFWIYVSIGAVQVLFGIYGVLMWTEARIWGIKQIWYRHEEAIWFGAFPSVWFGTALIWQAVRHYYAALVGTDVRESKNRGTVIEVNSTATTLAMIGELLLFVFLTLWLIRSGSFVAPELFAQFEFLRLKYRFAFFVLLTLSALSVFFATWCRIPGWEGRPVFMFFVAAMIIVCALALAILPAALGQSGLLLGLLSGLGLIKVAGIRSSVVPMEDEQLPMALTFTLDGRALIRILLAEGLVLVIAARIAFPSESPDFSRFIICVLLSGAMAFIAALGRAAHGVERRGLFGLMLICGIVTVVRAWVLPTPVRVGALLCGLLAGWILGRAAQIKSLGVQTK